MGLFINIITLPEIIYKTQKRKYSTKMKKYVPILTYDKSYGKFNR